MRKVFIIYIFLQTFYNVIVCDVTLDDQNNQENLSPLNDINNDDHEREHDKRTIFNSEIDNYGWAKHVGVHPSGFRYVLGIGPVDLKYVPVIRNPFKLANHRPKWPPKVFKPFRPAKPVREHVWKPSRPIVFRPVVRPVLPVIRPAVPFGKPVVFKSATPQWPNKSWQHDDWKPKPTKPVVPVTPVLPVQPAVKPLPPPQAVPVVPLQPVHPIVSIQPATPAVPVNPVVPINPVVQVRPVPQPVVPYPTTISTDPWVPVANPAYPNVPQQPLFEVTKPNLPVLPLGASFPSPILQQLPAGPGFVVQKPQLIHRNPAAVVEFHGNHHQHFISPNGFINIPKLASIQPQYAPQFTHVLPQAHTHIFSNGVHFQQNPQVLQNPFDAGQPISQVPQFQQSIPQVTQVQQLPRPQEQFFPQVTQVQQLPQPEQQYIPQVTHFQPHQVQEQQTPQVQQFVGQGQQVEDQYLPPVSHGQLPLEGDSSQQQQPQGAFVQNQQSNFFFQAQDQQFIQDNDYQQQQFQGSNSIQPGQTDVQTPLYLPPHNTYNPQVETFNNAFSNQFLSNQDGGFRPAASLEPPYNDFGYNRREDIGEEETEDSTEQSSTT